MTLASFACWWAIVWGFTMIATQSSLFSGFRIRTARMSDFFGMLVICPMCLGFWTGAASSLLGLAGPADALASAWPIWAKAWANGCASSALCWLTHVYLGHLHESRYDVTRR